MRIIEDKNEKIAAVIAGIFGMLWSVLTFFVIPVMAYENLGVFQAIKRSSSLLKNTWGERVGANFAFGMIGFIMFILIAVPAGFLVGMINVFAGVIVAVFLYVNNYLHCFYCGNSVQGRGLSVCRRNTRRCV